MPALPPVLQGSSGGGQIPGGQTATLECDFAAYPIPTAVQWYLDGVLLDASNSALNLNNGQWVATYTVSAVGVDTTGQYTCVGTNDIGSSDTGIFQVSTSCK